MEFLTKAGFLLCVAILGVVAPCQAKFAFTDQFIVQPWQQGDSPWNVDVVVDGLNRVHLLWAKRPAADPYHLHIYYRRYDSHGQPLTDIMDITPPGYELWGPLAIACNSWGKLAIAVYLQDYPTDQNHPFLWMSDSAGVLQPPVRYGNDLLYPWTSNYPALAVSESGRTIIAYENIGINDGDSLYYEVYDENNQKLTPSHAASSGEYLCHDATNCKVSVAPSGRFVIVWEASHTGDPNWPYKPNQISARIFDADGNPLSGELIPACEGFPDSCYGDTSIFYQGKPNGFVPDVALQDNGDFAISYMRSSWTCLREYYPLRRFYADGTPKGPNVKINDRTNCYDIQRESRTASDSAGNLLVVFELNDAPGGRKYNVYGQRFDSQGKRIGSNYRFNDAPPQGDAAGAIEYFSADMNRNGLVAVAWWDWGAFAPGWNLLLQIMDISDVGFYHPGDANNDTQVDISDAVFLIKYIFQGGWPPPDLCCGDANGDVMVDISDPVALISYIFSGGSIPVACPGR